MMKKIHLIQAETSLGSVNYGTELAPKALLDAGLERMLSRVGSAMRLADPVRHHGSGGTGLSQLRNADRLLPWLQALHAQLADTDLDEVQLVLGGDHSIGAPSLLSTKRRFSDAVCVYVDAHPDAHSLETTETGNIHGMPIRIAAGQTLDHIFFGPYYQPEEICMVGIKDIDAAEYEWLAKHDVQYFHMDDIIERGIGAVMSEVVAWVSGRPLHVSYDIDVIDAQYAPGTGIQNYGGLTYREAEYIARRLGVLQPVAIDMVEVNPERDPDGRTVELAIELIMKLLGARWSHYDQYLSTSQ